MSKYIPFYIIFFCAVVGLVPARNFANPESTGAKLNAVTYISGSENLVSCEFCRPTQLQLGQIHKVGIKQLSGGETDLTLLSIVSHLHFESSRDHALYFSHPQDNLLHNYPSHHFW